MKKWILPIVLIAAILVAGCIRQEPTPPAIELSGEAIADFWDDPDSYVGKEIVLTGIYRSMPATNTGKGTVLEHAIFPPDGTVGMLFVAKDDREFMEKETYTITGILVAEESGQEWFPYYYYVLEE